MWQANAQAALDSYMREGLPIKSANILCNPENDVHARVEAHAYTTNNNPRKQTVYPLIWNAVLFCNERAAEAALVAAEKTA